MRIIRNAADVEEGLRALVAADPRLEPIVAVAGAVPLRLREPGLEGLARIIVSQQISVSAATAIWGRFAAAVDPLTPAALAAADAETLRAAGLSAGKVKTLKAIAAACLDGSVDLAAVAGMEPADAHRVMTAIHGVGPWTADIFLLFCAGHPDIWPGGDLALQHALRLAFALEGRPAEKPCRLMAEAWSPWRGVAARLFWAYYAAVDRGRDVVPV
jgi:DNA-3-methyladenine glycosylase II